MAHRVGPVAVHRFDRGTRRRSFQHPALTGLGNAAAQAQAKLANVTTGDPAAFWANPPNSASSATCANNPAPVNCDGLERLNAFANILAACIQSASPYTDCGTLLTDTSGSTTLSAAHYMAVTPTTTNLAALFALQAGSPPFTPALSTAPDAFELALNFNPASSNFRPCRTASPSMLMATPAIPELNRQ